MTPPLVLDQIHAARSHLGAIFDGLWRTRLDYSEDRVGSSVTPAQITADKNDYSPAGGNVEVWRLSSDAARTITGIASGVSNRWLYLINVGANNITLANQSASSAAANRIITGTGANITAAADDVVHLWYDGITARWRVMDHY